MALSHLWLISTKMVMPRLSLACTVLRMTKSTLHQTEGLLGTSKRRESFIMTSIVVDIGLYLRALKQALTDHPMNTAITTKC